MLTGQNKVYSVFVACMYGMVGGMVEMAVGQRTGCGAGVTGNKMFAGWNMTELFFQFYVCCPLLCLFFR